MRKFRKFAALLLLSVGIAAASAQASTWAYSINFDARVCTLNVVTELSSPSPSHVDTRSMQPLSAQVRILLMTSI